mmetsp:Transcript_25637/g.39413  ORF Transcript_25637/g.39413 Transcript_25637/m.39413 type:complete len:299 (-) Transcript_25637:371-1267(-)|eukprot:CAMPEP_0195282594 /NCGR_PEP_ID=MMETSP0707-20130614/1392_1 /TAXON_ID=33640 /ORGANISM="Asterionellopsis glacialis, Strain CCMP134" /LENGTH=298 /DNA_ID=CAMNT_0040341577 /DNA_START=118 /DNA_END=1014 /DNA_ORIENTATION=-
MKYFVHFFFAVALLSVGVVDGFIFQAFKPNLELPKFAQEIQTVKILNIHLDVGKEDDHHASPHMNINGLIIELHENAVTHPQDHPKMPGANGPHPKLSSGVKSLSVVQDAFYIDMAGTKQVKFNNGCWEMIWRENAPAGSIICGFDVPQEVQRNAASALLPKGRLYISFPVWTRQALTESQKKKEDVHAKVQQYMQDRDDEFAKMQETSNPLMKALHYRNAAEAVEKYQLTGWSSYKSIPSNADVISIGGEGGDLVITKQGTIWTKGGATFLNSDGNHVLLGTAIVSPGTTIGPLYDE